MRRARWVFAGGILLFGLVLGLVLADVTGSLDRTIASDAAGWTDVTAWRVRALKIVTAFGASRWLWLVGSVAVIWLALVRRWRTGLWVAATALLGSGLNALVKATVGRERPEVALIDVDGMSFPSGHAMGALVVYGAILLAVWSDLSPRVARAALVSVAVLVVAIGATRVGLGVHFLTDVVGAFALGGAWLAAAAMARAPRELGGGSDG